MHGREVVAAGTACIGQHEGCTHPGGLSFGNASVSPPTSEQGTACGRAHECIQFKKIFNPHGFKFPSCKNRQGWALMRYLVYIQH